MTYFLQKKWLNKVLFLGSLCVVSFSVLAQYKVIGPDGSVTYTDQPPLDSKSKLEKLNISGFTSSLPEASLPYAIATVARNAPVTLYTSEGCAPCAQGRSLLQSRGIPYTEHTISTAADIEMLKTKNLQNSLPVLEIGRNFLQGFEAVRWHTALTDAAYPEQIKLPSNYQNGKTTPLAPPPNPVEASSLKPKEEARTAVSAPDNGFKFQK